jgi:hypothetical protein
MKLRTKNNADISIPKSTALTKNLSVTEAAKSSAKPLGFMVAGVVGWKAVKFGYGFAKGFFSSSSSVDRVINAADGAS